jgi:hypothetical protein
MRLALSPIIVGLSGVGQRLKVVAQHWLTRTDAGAVADLFCRDIAPPRAASSSEPTATLLPFPIRGEALLVKLAAHLKSVVERDRLHQSPFLFAMTHVPHARLLIDEMAHAEFDVARGEYRIQVLVSPDTRVTAETSDFDVMVDFIAQYMRERQVETSALGVAS